MYYQCTRTMQEKRVNIFTQSQYDPVNSTYKHRIYFEHLSQPLVGYSNKVGFRERSDKTDHLINVILRLMLAEYYPGSTRDILSLAFSLNTNDEKVVTLYPTFADWNPKYLTDKKLTTMIARMYEMREKKIPINHIFNILYIRSRKRTVRFDSNDLSHRFSSSKDLEKYCQSLLKEGYAAGEVEHYYRMYMEKNFIR